MGSTTPAIFTIAISLYVVLLLFFAWRKPATHQALVYVMAGRKLTLLPFVATLVSTTYGWILGTGQLYYEYGISAWLFLSVPYAMFSLLMAFGFSELLRKQQFQTLPDLLDFHYGKRMATLGSVLILLFTSPAMYVLMAAQILVYFYHWPMLPTLLACSFFSVLYLFKGGFRAVVQTDIFQFVLMFAGFAALLLWLFLTHGVEPILSVPDNKLTFQAEGNGWYILSWFVFASITLVDPNYHQRINAVDEPKTARKGILLSVVAWVIFDFFTAAAALYAYAFNSNIESKQEVFLSLASDHVHPWVGAVFVVALLATVFSTANSFFFTGAISISKDILHRNKLFMHLSIEKLNNYVLLVLAAVTFIWLIPYADKNVVSFFFDITPYVVSALLLPVLGSYFKKLKLIENQVLVQTILALSATAAAFIFETELNPVFYGLLSALLYQLVMLLARYF